MSEDNVIDMDVYRLADLIAANWLDAYSDSGAIWERSHKTLELLKKQVSPEMWQKAVDIANRRFGQQ